MKFQEFTEFPLRNQENHRNHENIAIGALQKRAPNAYARVACERSE